MRPDDETQRETDDLPWRSGRGRPRGRRWPRRRGALSLVALAVAILLAGVVAAAPAAGADPQTKVKDPLPLLELIAPGGSGRLYTLNQREARVAVEQYGYRLEPVRTGYMRQARFAGSRPLFRLRLEARPAYLITASRAERDALVASGRFVYEGVLGHVAARPSPATTTLWRYSNGSEWRLTLESGRAELERQGYRADGRLGYVPEQWIRAGALYFGSWNSGARNIIDATKRVYGRSGDWFGGVRDYSGQDPRVPTNRWLWPNDDFSHLKPAIGWYDDSRRRTSEAHIAEASSAGLSYFSFYWYWDGTAEREYVAGGLHSFLRARNRNAIDFALGICSHDYRPLEIPVEQFDRVANLLARKYLSRPNYLRANDGRPILEICDSRGLGSGSDADVRAFVDAVRDAARRALGEEILVLGEWQLGLDPATGAEGRYCGARVSRPAGSYRTYVDTHRAFLDSITGTFVRCAMSDFDERPRYPIQITDPERVRWYADQTPQLFARSVGIVADDIAVSTRPPVVDNFVQIYAWNEWHEGGIIEPNLKDGCTYLDIIQRELALRGGGAGYRRP
ncbi:MAG: hypothetical protein GEU88_12530 [Solirubrobacterales bacterium]|nr:hypothetical protein [Solirubrobacterales bacterium]